MKRSDYLYELHLAMLACVSMLDHLAKTAAEGYESSNAYFEAQTQMRRLLKMQTAALGMPEDK